MRVAHLCDAFSPVSETAIYDYITTMRQLGVDAHVVTARRVNGDAFPYDQVVEIKPPARWRPARVVMKGLSLAGLRAGFWPETHAGAVERHLRALDPDVLHAHFGTVGVATLSIVRRLGKPLVVSFHGLDAFALPRRPHWRRHYASLFRHCARVTAVSEVMVRRIVKLGCPEDRVSVVHAGVDTSRLQMKPDAGRGCGGGTALLCVGRMVEKKGFAVAVRAASEARAVLPGITLSIIGEGPERQKVENLARSLGLEQVVRLRGTATRDTVIEAMKAADILLLPSLTARNGDREGIPLVLLEAQALGVPVIATRHSGIPEGLAPENHDLLVDEGSPSQIAERMLLLAANPDRARRAAEAGRRHVEAHFDIQKEVGKLIGIYGECCATGRGGMRH